MSATETLHEKSLFTGHEEEMAARLFEEEEWAKLPRARRQADVMLSHIQTAIEYLSSAGKENLFFGEIESYEGAVAGAIRHLKKAIDAAENQA